MKRHRSPLNAFAPYADVLMCVLAFMMLLTSLLLVVAHINVTAKKDSKPKAEYLVTLTWSDARDVDLDLWLQDPANEIIYYNNREVPNISLDRDSRGFATNHTILPDGTIAASPNREVIAIRAVIPGDYIAAVSYYSGHDETNGHEYSVVPPDSRAPIDCRVEVEKINPEVTTVAIADLHLTQVKEGQNAIAFRVDADGNVTVLPLPSQSIISQHQQIGE